MGRAGPTCEVDLLSACQELPRSDIRSCGTYAPKNCECFRQCYDYYCHGEKNILKCEHELGQKLGEIKCYRYKGKPREEQKSFLPKVGDDVEWYWGSPSEWGPGDTMPETRKLPNSEWFKCKGGNTLMPPDECPNKCSEHGICVKDPWRNYCLCRKGYKGEDCSKEDSEEDCWFSPTCGRHGTCKRGFCHCEPGWWGFGCGRSKAFSLAPEAKAIPSRSTLRIYMYDLPARIAYPGEYDDGAFGRDAMYIGYEYFIKSFLKDWAVRTENPHEANLFFVPALLYFYVGNVRDPIPHLTRVIQHISWNFPFWNRTGGRDHFFWMSGDKGSCMLPRELQDTAIKVVHFGMNMKDIDWQDVPNKDYACVRPVRDIVTPPVADLPFVREGKPHELYQKILARQGDDGLTRDLLFFFVGGVQQGDLKYSGGARQALYKHLHTINYTDVLVHEGRRDDYETLFLRSKFCVTPYGYGWGLRLSIAMMHACIPIVIQDHVYQPFEELLPYHEFSVRLAVRDIPHIVDILRQYTEVDLKALRLNMAKHYKAFLWPEELGGGAYNATLLALRRRLFNYASEYY